MELSSLLSSPPSWTNQQLTLYHGTIDTAATSILAGVDCGQGRARTDFGQGFYTTTWLDQARLRAWHSSLRYGAVPVVVRFEVERHALARLDSLWFVRGGFGVEDFWSFVHHCRGGRPGHGCPTNDGWYDLVVGPLVASWKQRLVVAEADQISFHTSRAANLLNRSHPQVMEVL